MRHRIAFAVAVCTLMSLACAPSSENTPLPNSGPIVPKPAFDARVPLEGALPQGMGKIDATQFRAAVANIKSWNGGGKGKRCTPPWGCGAGFSKEPVTIEPAHDAANAAFTNVGSNGSIVLRLKNVGKKKTGGWGLYELEPGITYYVVVSSANGTTGRWDLVPFADNQTTQPVSIQTGNFKSCDHGSSPPASSAAFYGCDEAKKYAGDSTSLVKTASLGVFELAADAFQLVLVSIFDQAPAWVSCAYGCCTLE